MRVTILGCGSSSGVPIIGCECDVCKSGNPKNNRRRASILVEDNNTKILIDTSPDLRQQALDNYIKTVDAILFTHAHADHIYGLNDVRAFNYNADKELDIYSNDATLRELMSKFSFAFMPKVKKYKWPRPCLVPHVISAGDVLNIGSMKIDVFKQLHGFSGQTLGFRFGDFAYSTDVKELPEEAFTALEGVKVWIIEAFQPNPAPTHSHLLQTLEWIERLKPKQAIITHMGHEFDYKKLSDELPDNIVPAYDNMVINV